MTLIERIELGKTQIISDCRDGHFNLTDPLTGIVSLGITSFSDLHDYVDANFYGLTQAEWAGDGSPCDELTANDCALGNELQDALDAWIKAGGLLAASQVEAVL